MDPDACITRVFRAMDDRDWRECRATCEDLLGWLAGGGFPPRGDLPSFMGSADYPPATLRALKGLRGAIDARKMARFSG